jgi:hypothetical protein
MMFLLLTLGLVGYLCYAVWTLSQMVGKTWAQLEVSDWARICIICTMWPMIIYNAAMLGVE